MAKTEATLSPEHIEFSKQMNAINAYTKGELYKDQDALAAMNRWVYKVFHPTHEYTIKMKVDKLTAGVLKTQALLEINQAINKIKDPEDKEKAQAIADAWKYDNNDKSPQLFFSQGKADKSLQNAVNAIKKINFEDISLQNWVLALVIDFVTNGEQKDGTFGAKKSQKEIIQTKADLIKNKPDGVALLALLKTWPADGKWK